MPRMITTILVIVLFLFNYVADGYFLEAAQAEMTDLFVSGKSSDQLGFSFFSHEANIDNFTISRKLGAIKDIYEGNSGGKMLIHIRDAHADYECQRTIADIIAEISREYSVNTVYLEGGSGGYNLEPFLKINDSIIREKVADHFLKQAEMNGAEYFAVNNPGMVGLWGVEDIELYCDNLRIYKDYLRRKIEITGFINEIEEVLDEFKAKVYSPCLIELDRICAQYENSEIEYKQYIEYLLQKFKQGPKTHNSSSRAGLKEKFPEIYKLTRVFEKEIKIDFEKAEDQRDMLVELVLKKFPERRLETFAGKLDELKKGRISEWMFYEYLGQKAEQVDINLREDLPELSKYSEYVKTYAEMDKSRLMDQVALLEDFLRDMLAQNPVQKRLVFLSKHLALTEKLFKFAFSRKDFDYYEAHTDNFNVENYVNFANKFVQSYNIQRELKPRVKSLNKYAKEVINFYEYSFERDKSFIKNMLEHMDSPRAGKTGTASILVTGGFHSEALLELLKQERISYVSIMPKYEKTEEKCRYFDLLSGERTDMISHLDAALSNLQIASKLNIALGEKIWGQRNIKLHEAVVYIQTLVEYGKKIVIYDDESKKMLTSFGEGEDVENISKNEFFHKIHEKFIDGVMGGGEEGYRDLNVKEVQAAQEAFKQILNILPEKDNAIQFLKEKRKDLKDFIRISYNLVKTKRDGHAGGWGIRIRDGLSMGEAQKVIRHELLAGILKDNSVVEQVEELIDEENIQKIHRILKDTYNRYENNKVLWQLEDRIRVERDYAASANQEITDEDVRQIFEKESYLTNDERQRICAYVTEFNSDYKKVMKSIKRTAPDPARYTVSIREIKRFAKEFKRIYMEELDKKKPGDLSFSASFAAMTDAYKSVYMDFVDMDALAKMYDKETDSGIKTAMMSFLLFNNNYNLEGEEKYWPKSGIKNVELYKRTYAKLKRGIESKIPTLFIKSKDSLQALEVSLSEYTKENKNVQVFSVQCTPYSDTAQLVGEYVPRGRIELKAARGIIGRIINDDKRIKEILAVILNRSSSAEVSDKEIKTFRDIYRQGKDSQGLMIASAMAIKYPRNWRKKLVYKKGILARVIDECQKAKNADKVFVLNFENIEALPGRVRAQLNNFLSAEEMWVPRAEKETDRHIIMPGNLRIIASMNENSVLEDGAFYDRFIRKSIPSCTNTDIKETIKLRHPSLHEEVADFLSEVKIEFDTRSLDYSTMDFITISDYVSGRFEQSGFRREIRFASDDLKLVLEESMHYFYAKFGADENEKYKNAVEHVAIMWNTSVLDFLPSVLDNLPKFLKRKVTYNDKSQELIFNDVGLKINKKIAGKIESALKEKYNPTKPEKQEEIIEEVLLDELDFLLTEDHKKMLSAIARSYRFGSGVIRLEGTTGAGKTYLAEALSKLLDFTPPDGKGKKGDRFYAEPIHAKTKLARLTGMFKVDEYGYYSLDTDTKFLNIIKNGGIAALSELNTAVRDNYAKLGWWLIQFARGDDAIYLTENPGYGQKDELSPHIKRNKKSLIIIDINPEDYSARGELPDDLKEYAPGVHVSAPGKADIKKAAKAFLRHVKNERVREDISKTLTDFHCLVQDVIDGEVKKGVRCVPLSFRELRRSACCIGARDDIDTASMKFKRALNTYYISAFKRETQDVLRLPSSPGFNIPKQNTEDIIDEILFKNAGERSPPVLVFAPAEENPFEELDKVLEKRKNENVYCEKVLITKFTDEFKLLGGYVPVSKDMTLQKAYRFLKDFLEEDIENIKEAEALYKKLTNKDFPLNIKQIPESELLSLAVALDAVCNNEEWAPKLEYKQGIIPRLIYEAAKHSQKTYMIAMENFHRIRPGLAVALNSVLQEGLFYDPMKKKPVTVPKNLKFFATAIEEMGLPISVAEESRWVRLRRGIKTRDEKREILKTYFDKQFHYKLSQYAQEEGIDIDEAIGKIFTKDWQKIIKDAENWTSTKLEGYLFSGLRIAEFLKNDLFSVNDFKCYINAVIEEFIATKKPFDEFDEKNEIIIKHRYLTFETALRKDRDQPPELGKKGIREYFDNFLSDKTAKPDDEEDELLEEIDELIEVEAATFQAFSNDRIAIYEGPPGGGKTDMAIDCARRMGLDHYVYSCHGRVHAADLLGGFRQDSDGKFIFTGTSTTEGKYEFNKFLDMLTHGGVFIFDEGAIGARSQALMSLLSSLARGEEVFVMNEVPGEKPELLNVHKDFHIIITMNPPEDTPGREPLPLEVYNHAKKIWVSNRLSQQSYRRIIKKFALNACKRQGIELETLFNLEEFPEEFADFVCDIHFLIDEMVGSVISLDENQNLHLLTLRDMKKVINRFVEYRRDGLGIREALRVAIRVEYIDQFKETGDRPAIQRKLKAYKKAEATEFFKKCNVNIEKLFEELLEEMDEGYLDEDWKREKETSDVLRKTSLRKIPLPEGVTEEDLERTGFAKFKPVLNKKVLTQEEKDQGYNNLMETIEMEEPEKIEIKEAKHFTDLNKPLAWGNQAHFHTETREMLETLVTPIDPAKATGLNCDNEAFVYEETLHEAFASMLNYELPVMLDFKGPRNPQELYKILKSRAGSITSMLVTDIMGNECLVTGHKNGEIKIWDIKNGKVTTLVGYNNEVHSLTTLKVKDDSSGNEIKYLASVGRGNDKAVLLWDITDIKKIRCRDNCDCILSAARQPPPRLDGGYLSVIRGVATVKLYGREWLAVIRAQGIELRDISSGKKTIIKTLKFNRKALPSNLRHKNFGVVTINGEEHIAIYCDDDLIDLWHFSARGISGRALKLKKSISLQGSFTSVKGIDETSGEEKEFLAVGMNDKDTPEQIGLIDIDKKEMKVYGGGDPCSVAQIDTMSYGGKEYLVTGDDHNLKLWDFSEKERKVLIIPAGYVEQRSFASMHINGRPHIAANNDTSDIKIFDIFLKQAVSDWKEDMRKWHEEQEENKAASPKAPPLPEGVTMDDLKNKPRKFGKWKEIFTDGALTEEEEKQGYGSIEKQEKTSPIENDMQVIQSAKEFDFLLNQDMPDDMGYLNTRSIKGDVVSTCKISLLSEEKDLTEDEISRIVDSDEIKQKIEQGNIFVYEQSFKTILKDQTLGYPSVMNHRIEDDIFSELYMTLKVRKPLFMDSITINNEKCMVSVTNMGYVAVKLWNIKHRTVKTFFGCSGNINSFSIIQREGQEPLMVERDDETVRMWDFSRSEYAEVISFKVQNEGQCFTSMKIGSRNCLVSSGSCCGIIEIWDFWNPEGRKMVRLKGHGEGVTALTVIKNPEGRECLITTGWNDKIKIWDFLGKKKTIKTFRGKSEGLVGFLTTITINNEKYFVSGREKGKDIEIWKLFKSGNISKQVLTGHTDNIRCIKTVTINGREYLLSSANDNITRIWNIAEKRKETVLTLKTDNGVTDFAVLTSEHGKEFLATIADQDTAINLYDLTFQEELQKAVDEYARLQEEQSACKPELPKKPQLLSDLTKAKSQMLLPEQNSIVEARYALRGKGRVLLIMQAGARERVVIDEVAKRERIKEVHSIEGSPFLTIFDMFGGLSPVFEHEEFKEGRKLIYKHGFFTRYMVREEEYRSREYQKQKHDPVLLVIHNIDAIPEKARTAINNLLLNGYVEVPGEGKFYLPKHIKIIATINAESQEDFSSAFPNRLTKVNVREMETSPYWLSPFVKYVMQVYNLDKKTAESIESVYCMIKWLEAKGSFWPSRYEYNFTVKDALTAAQFVSLAIKEQKRIKLALNKADITRIIIKEAIRSYGARLKQNKTDYEKFITYILKMVFNTNADLIDSLSAEFAVLNGKLDTIDGIPVKPTSKGEHPYTIDKRYRLTLVSSIVKTLSSIVRGFQAGKIVALTGDTGVAKTTMGVVLAKLMGIKHYVFSVHKEVKAYDLTAGISVTDEGKYKQEISDFARRLEKGNTVLVVDEANIKPEILWILAGIARGEKTFTIEVPGDKPISFELGRNVFVLLTMNPEEYGGGRDVLPQPVKEDIFSIWAPSEYPEGELDAIVNEFFDGYSPLDNVISKMEEKEEYEPIDIDIDECMLMLSSYIDCTYAMKMGIEELLDLIDEKGHMGAFVHIVENYKKEAKENLMELDRKIRVRKDVQSRMENIRLIIGINCEEDIKIKFSLYEWWSCDVNGKTINVPLYELVKREPDLDGTRRGRTDDQIAGIIIHEIRHKRYTPTAKEWREEIIPEMTDNLTPEELTFLKSQGAEVKEDEDFNPVFHELGNLIEDIRINNIPHNRFRGEQTYVETLREIFKGKLKEKAKVKEKILELVITRPHEIFLDELTCFGYNGEHSAYFKYLPGELKEDIKTIVDGDNSPLKRAALVDSVKINFRNIKSKNDIKKEKLRAAMESMHVILKEINPVYQKWVARDIVPRQKKRSDIGDGKGKPEPVELPPELAEKLKSGKGQGEGEEDEIIILTENGEQIPFQDGIVGDEEDGKDGKSGEEGGKPGKDETPGTRGSKFDDDLEEAEEKRLKEIIEAEPFNLRLMEVSDISKLMAKAFVNLFRVAEEPDIEESAYGRIINIIRFIIGSNLPFDEEIDGSGVPDLAMGMTIDTSGSMKSFYDALRRLSAILLSSFQQIGRKGEFSITIDSDVVETVKEFEEKFSQEELNGVQKKVEDKIGKRGNGIHLYKSIREMIKKYEKCNKGNKLEILYTDCEDMDGDLELSDSGELSISDRLKKALEKAQKMGISIIAVGFKGNTTYGYEDTKAIEIFRDFGSFIKLDPANPDALVNIMISIARIKAKTGKVPRGDLSEMFDSGHAGAVKKDAFKYIDLSPKNKPNYKLFSYSKEGPVENDLTRSTISDTTGERGRKYNVPQDIKKQVQAARETLPDMWKHTTKDIIVLPQTELYKAQEASVRAEMRKMDKKYAQATVTFGYTFSREWKPNLEEIITKAINEFSEDMARGGETKTRLIAYIPVLTGNEDKKFIKNILENPHIKPFAERITFIQMDNIIENIPINVVMHIILGKALLNFERYEKGDFKGEMEEGEKTRIVELIKTMVSNPRDIDLKFLKTLIKGETFLKIQKIDFTEITLWKKLQKYIAVSV